MFLRQEVVLFTHESRRVLFDQVNQSNTHSNTRNYYEQLFSSDSEDDEINESSDMSISDSEHSSNSKNSTFTPIINLPSQLNLTSSDMSILTSNSLDIQSINSEILNSSNPNISSNNSTSTLDCLSALEDWQEEGNDTWGMA